LLIAASPEEAKHIHTEESEYEPAEDSQPSIEQVNWTERVVTLLSIPIFKRRIEGIFFAFTFTTALLLEVMVCLLLLLIRVPIVLIELISLLRSLPLPLIHLLHVFLKLRKRISAASVAFIWATAAEILEKLLSLSLEFLLVVKVAAIVKGILIAFGIFVCRFAAIVFLLLLLLL